MKKMNPFHLLNPSPWPIISSLNLNILFMNTALLLKKKSITLTTFSLITLSLSSILWWNSIKMESSLKGMHTNKTSMMFKKGMILFIISETMIFMSLFWTYIHSMSSPSIISAKTTKNQKKKNTKLNSKK